MFRHEMSWALGQLTTIVELLAVFACLAGGSCMIYAHHPDQ